MLIWEGEPERNTPVSRRYVWDCSVSEEPPPAKRQPSSILLGRIICNLSGLVYFEIMELKRLNTYNVYRIFISLELFYRWVNKRVLRLTVKSFPIFSIVQNLLHYSSRPTFASKVKSYKYDTVGTYAIEINSSLIVSCSTIDWYLPIYYIYMISAICS